MPGAVHILAKVNTDQNAASAGLEVQGAGKTWVTWSNENVYSSPAFFYLHMLQNKNTITARILNDTF